MGSPSACTIIGETMENAGKPKKEFVKAIFCAPTGRYEEYGFPSRLTDDVFKKLKEAGINRIFGFGWDNRDETKTKTLELCEKYGIAYLPSLDSFGQYIALGSKEKKEFDKWTEEETLQADAKLIEEVKKYLPYKAFKGVFFGDEAGYLSLNGVAHAKKVFSKNFPDLEFHFNFFSYSINEPIFWGGMELSRNPNMEYSKPFELDDAHKITFENRFRFYDMLLSHLLDQAKFEFVSQDKYPFEAFWKEVPTSVHVALFELNAYFAEKKKKYGYRFYNYLQAGQWGAGSNRQHMSEGEMLLQTNVTIGYGNEGYSYFPGCFPIDFAFSPELEFAKNGASSLIDISGKPGEVYPFVKKEQEFVSLIEDDILNSEFLGVTSYGNYDNGFREEEIGSLPDNECIFRGKLPDFVRYEDSSLKASCSNEIMVSAFIKEGKKRYFITNLSSVYGNEADLSLPGSYSLIQGTHKIRFAGNVHLSLTPGEAAYLIQED